MLVDLVQTTTRDGVRLDGALQTPSGRERSVGLDALAFLHGTGGNFYSSTLFDAFAELFLEPGRECLVARDGLEVAEAVLCLTDEGVRDLGDAARRRVLAEHTYSHRAVQVEQVLGYTGRPSASREVRA